MKGTIPAPDTLESLGAVGSIATYYGSYGGDLNNADTCVDDLALLSLTDPYNQELRTLFEDTFAYVRTWKYAKSDPASNRCQIAIGYSSPKMAIRVYRNGVWSPWTLLAVGA